jgi:lipopolysaccharide/colanic/teichoic acid biosynthesis glycosyltransferase
MTRTTKRALDLTLLLPLVPAWAIVTGMLAGIVGLVDGRPLFFTQLRYGRGRTRFRVWKLRTMTTEPDELERRPTRLGRFLRERGLDELPQLYNVLRGDMSLVGPRPLTPADAARLASAAARFDERFAVPPGLTGLAQICGVRGAALTAAVDGYYVANASVAADLGVLWRTAWINVVGKRRGMRPMPPAVRRPG